MALGRHWQNTGHAFGPRLLLLIISCPKKRLQLNNFGYEMAHIDTLVCHDDATGEGRYCVSVDHPSLTHISPAPHISTAPQAATIAEIAQYVKDHPNAKEAELTTFTKAKLAEFVVRLKMLK